MVSTDTPHSNVDLGAVESWVRLIHGESQGYVHICSTLSWSGRVFQVAIDMETIKNYVQHLHDAGAKGIYMRATTIGRPLERGERGSIEDSVTLPGFWADIDLTGPGHKTNKPLPPTVEEAARIIQEARLPEPTLWVHSGGGVYPWWLFQTPILMVNGEIVAAMQDMSERWHECLVDAAKRLGYSYGAMADLSRVLRLPGTLNRKLDDPQPRCQIVWDEGPRFSDEEIEAALEAAEEYRTWVTPAPQPTIPRPRPADAGERPGDALANQYTWEEILEPHGYQFDRQQGEETYWVRPGKNRRDGHSCTTNYQGSGLLYVFSDAMDGFEPNRSYSKFATWAILNNHGNDFKAAAKDLRSRGFGAQRQQNPHLQPTPLQPLPENRHGDGAVEEAAGQIVVPTHFRSTDVGNGERLQASYGNVFRWVGQHNSWYAWTGEVWKPDYTARIDRAAVAVTNTILDEADALRDQLDGDTHDPDDEKCKCLGCKMHKFGIASQSDSKIKAMISRMKGLEGISVRAEDFDQDAKLITVGNGVLDPERRELYGFDSRRMLTQQMAVNYVPDATAPKFERFLEQVLPDAEVRDYVQRALGYTLLGENDQRVLFMINGPSGTGKSQFLNIFEGLFGDFGTTAAAATFRHTRNEATNDLHALRGKRFVTTSETSETSAMDEELIKRITGRDSITSRDLYQSNMTWVPRCAIWFATNFPPKLNSDDSAIWDRFKAITFDQQFTRDGGKQVPDIGKKILAEEASGILNWLLDGVRKYRERGLTEPGTITEAVAQQRLDADNVAQFLTFMIEEGRLEESETAKVSRATLYDLYESWCQKDRQHPLGQRRFTRRLRALRGYGEVKMTGIRGWSGIGLTSQAGLMGTMG
jgi:putative DNA primase/helicase